jgi:hypothetical protein
MKQIKHMLLGSIVTLLVVITISAIAQVNRPFKNGTVWNVSFIRIKPGMNVAYMNYLAGQWKKEQDALKAEGMTLSYKVLATEAHGTGDWNLLLMTEYKDMATMEANEDKADALAQRVVGNDDNQKQMQGYKDRLEIREVMGTRLAREIVFK